MEKNLLYILRINKKTLARYKKTIEQNKKAKDLIVYLLTTLRYTNNIQKVDDYMNSNENIIENLLSFSDEYEYL